MNSYIHRVMENELKASIKEFPVVILTGPRQTGKSTLLKQTFPEYDYATLDDPLTRKLASDDPNFFLSRANKIIIDEIQYLPNLLHYIKIFVDRNREYRGRFILTGSQYFPLMAGITESLTGRAVLFELLGFSSEEILFLGSHSDKTSVYKAMHKGFFPEIVAQNVDRNRFYSSYLQTYLERDIRQITSVHDLRTFQNFLELIAARAGALLNLNEISKECGVSSTSARRWLSLLETGRTVYLLRSYSKNISKRIIKSPKIYFTDTGLLSYLLRYQDALTMQNGPQAGAFFENLVVNEILKYKFNHNLNFEIYFYRDSNHNEIDIVLDYGMSVKLIEVKLTSTPRNGHFTVLKQLCSELKNSRGYLVCFQEKKEQIAENIEILPWHRIIDVLGKS